MKKFVQSVIRNDQGDFDRISLTLLSDDNSVAGALEMSFSESGEEVTFTIANPAKRQRITFPIVQADWLVDMFATAVEDEMEQLDADV